MALRDYKNYQEDYVYQELPEEQLPLYQEYIPESDIEPKIKELLFFFNIAAFCILTASDLKQVFFLPSIIRLLTSQHGCQKLLRGHFL